MLKRRTTSVLRKSDCDNSSCCRCDATCSVGAAGTTRQCHWLPCALTAAMYSKPCRFDSLVDSTNLGALNTFPNGVILLREGFLKQLVVQLNSVDAATFMLVQTKGQVYSTVQTRMLWVLGSKPRNSPDNLLGTASSWAESQARKTSWKTKQADTLNASTCYWSMNCCWCRYD